MRRHILTKRKKIKANRKPKIVRDRTWRQRVLQGEIDLDLEVPRVQRISPRGKEEDQVERWAKLEGELSLQEMSSGSQTEVGKDQQQGTVIKVSLGLYHVDLGDRVIICAARGSLSAVDTGYTNVVAVGDRVLVSTDTASGGVIDRVLPRQTVLARPDVVNQDLGQIIVSNVDQLLIVSSWVEPDIWYELIDRSLISAAEGKMTPLICVNKVDLAWNIQNCEQEIAVYRELGYPVMFTSATTNEGIDELCQHLVGHSTVVVGLSGVGKSSLLMAVQPDLKLRVGDVSEYSGQGRHTTTQVSLLKLDDGGYVVDTPGIRELGLLKVHRYELVLHFPDILPWVEFCRFNDCTHFHEPGCAVLAALERKEIEPSRYGSYCTIYESLSEYYTE